MSVPLIAAAIRSVLTDDLRRAPWQGDPNPMKGHCYVASEALYHALGGRREPDLAVCQMEHEDSPHWWIEFRGFMVRDVYDLTADQFETPVPYHAGKRRGFLTRRPSKRAREVLKRVRAIHPGLLALASDEYTADPHV